MPNGLTTTEKIRMIFARMIAVFVANGLAIIGAGSIIGIDTLSSVLLAGALGVAKVTEGLARGFLDDGKLTLEEINEAFTGEKMSDHKTNGFTQKEMLVMILEGQDRINERIDDLHEKTNTKISRAELSGWVVAVSALVVLVQSVM